jgi:glycosyltransferase involved in cell wall biosynthesis
MKIALLGSRGIPARYSGYETFYEQLAVRLAQRGHQVTVYNRAHHGAAPSGEYRGVRIVTVRGIRSKHLDTLSHTALSLMHALAGRHDILYLSIVGNSPLCLLTRLLGQRTILNVDGVDAEREKWSPLARAYLRWSERLASRFADVVIADARVIQRRYQQLYGRDSIFIPYGANLWAREREAANTDVLDSFGLRSDGYVLFVSRLTPENGAHTLIEAFKRARTKLKLAVVGDAPYAADYQRHLRQLAASNVVLTGYLFEEAYRQISCHCRFFVLPAAIEGTRPVLLDQMAFGNCVLVKDGAANQEVVGDAGLVYSRHDEMAALTAHIEQLSVEDAMVRDYRQRALARVATTYSWDAVTDQYEALFARMLARGPHRRPSRGFRQKSA